MDNHRHCGPSFGKTVTFSIPRYGALSYAHSMFPIAFGESINDILSNRLRCKVLIQARTLMDLDLPDLVIEMILRKSADPTGILPRNENYRILKMAFCGQQFETKMDFLDALQR